MLPAPAPQRQFPTVALAAVSLLTALLLASRGSLLQWPPVADLRLPAPTLLAMAAVCGALLLLALRQWRGAALLGGATALGSSLDLARRLLAADFEGAAMLGGQAPATAAFVVTLLAAATTVLALGRTQLAVHGARACAGTALLVLVEAWLDGWQGGGRILAEGGREVLLLPLLPASATLALLSHGQAQPGPQRPVDRWAAWCPVLLAGFTFIAWSHLEEREWRERTRDTALARASIAEDVAERLRLRGEALQRLADRMVLYQPTREQWEREGRDYLRDFPSLHALILSDPQLVVQWRVASDGNVDLVGRSLAADDGRLAVFRKAAEIGQPRLTPPVTLRSGGVGLVIVAAVLERGELRGYLSASIQAPDLLEVAATPVLRHFAVSLRAGDTLVAGDADRPPSAAAALAQQAQVDALGQFWTLDVWPRPAYLQRMRSQLPETVFALGLLASLLVAAAFLQARRSVTSTMAAQTLAARLTETLESITDALYTLDRDWRFAYVNREAERLLQRGRQELLGREVWSEYPAIRGTAFEANYRRAVAESVTVSFEEYYPPFDRWFGVRAYPTPQGLAVYFQDVTALVRSREALRHSEHELRALAESMPQMVWMAQPDGAITYYNQRWMDFTGLTLQESCGAGWARAVHPDDLAAVQSAWETARAGTVEHSVEARIRRADGTWRWMLIRAVPFRGPDGSVTKWMGTNTDIDAIRQSMEALRASEERFRLLARASNDAIWDSDLQTGAVWWSDSFDALFGRTSEADATFAGWCARVHPDDRERVVDTVTQALRHGQDVWSADCRFCRAGGEWARVHVRGYVIRDTAGRPTRVVGGMTDVTARTELEQRLRQSQRLESVGQLTGGVAHDFNNLLTVILGNAETLAEELADQPRLQALAAMMLSAAERGAELTGRLLAFARKQALAPESVDIARQLDELAPLLRRTLGEHIAIRLVLPPQLWRAQVDPGQLDNALLNLCLNARDAMPAGGTLTLSATNSRLGEEEPVRQPDVAAGDYVLLSVADTGAGIAAEHADRIFEPFFTTKQAGKGTGLGLAMVYGFVKQSGGQVGVASEPGRGTTFTLYLPRATASAPPARPPEAPSFAVGGDAAVLLVEDDPLVRSHARVQLEALGYRVTEAASGDEALAVLQRGEPADLLFTDLVMPGMSGPQLAQRARRTRPGLQVLYTSGYAEDAVLHQAGAGPDTDLLHKPYSRDELARRVRSALLRASA